MAEASKAPLCAHCKIHKQMPRAIIAGACKSCNRALFRVVLAQAGRDPNTGAASKNPDPRGWLP